MGLQVKSWPIIFLGRLIFGFGGESFTVANSALLADWFKGRELAFAFGVNLAIRYTHQYIPLLQHIVHYNEILMLFISMYRSKLGSVFNNILSPILADRVDLIFAMWFGAMLCGMSMICVLLTIPIDRGMDAELEKITKYAPVANAEVEDLAAAQRELRGSASDVANPLVPVYDMQAITEKEEQEQAEADNAENVSFNDALKLPRIFWVLVASCVVVYGCILPFNNISSSLLLERDYFKEPGDSCTLTDPFQCESDSNPPLHCPSSKWYQPPLPYNATVDGEVYNPLSTSDIDCSDDAWKNGCTKEYCSRQNDAISRASVVMSIPYIISAVLSPPLGFLVDIYGQRAVISFIAPIMLIIVHSMMGFSSIGPIAPLVGQGLAYTGFVSVLWPSIPLVVEDKLTGLGFGIVTSMQNLACAIIPLVAASIYSSSGDEYIPNVELLFVILAICGAIVGVYMNYYDYYYGNNILNSPCLISDDQQQQASASVDHGRASTSSAGNLPRSNSALGAERMSVGAAEASLAAYLLSREGAQDGPDRAMSVDSHRSNSRRSHRGTSFTSYEEVMRGGGYRTSTTASVNQKTHHL
jgi:hypothetical protein